MGADWFRFLTCCLHILSLSSPLSLCLLPKPPPPPGRTQWLNTNNGRRATESSQRGARDLAHATLRGGRQECTRATVSHAFDLARAGLHLAVCRSAVTPAHKRPPHSGHQRQTRPVTSISRRSTSRFRASIKLLQTRQRVFQGCHQDGRRPRWNGQHFILVWYLPRKWFGVTNRRRRYVLHANCGTSDSKSARGLPSADDMPTKGEDLNLISTRSWSWDLQPTQPQPEQRQAQCASSISRAGCVGRKTHLARPPPAKHFCFDCRNGLCSNPSGALIHRTRVLPNDSCFIEAICRDGNCERRIQSLIFPSAGRKWFPRVVRVNLFLSTTPAGSVFLFVKVSHLDHNPAFESEGPSWVASQVRTTARIALQERDLQHKLQAALLREHHKWQRNAASRTKRSLLFVVSVQETTEVRHEEMAPKADTSSDIGVEHC